MRLFLWRNYVRIKDIRDGCVCVLRQQRFRQYTIRQTDDEQHSETKSCYCHNENKIFIYSFSTTSRLISLKKEFHLFKSGTKKKEEWEKVLFTEHHLKKYLGKKDT
jgi:hypothetical protein